MSVACLIITRFMIGELPRRQFPRRLKAICSCCCGTSEGRRIWPIDQSKIGGAERPAPATSCHITREAYCILKQCKARIPVAPEKIRMIRLIDSEMANACKMTRLENPTELTKPWVPPKDTKFRRRLIYARHLLKRALLIQRGYKLSTLGEIAIGCSWTFCPRA